MVGCNCNLTKKSMAKTKITNNYLYKIEKRKKQYLQKRNGGRNLRANDRR